MSKMAERMYTLSIENKGGERTVDVIGSDGFHCQATHNPDKVPGPLNYDSGLFDTSFSIVHPMRDVAEKIAEQYVKSGDSKSPEIKKDISVDEAQRILFQNILTQEIKSLHTHGITYRKAQEGTESRLHSTDYQGWKPLEL